MSTLFDNEHIVKKQYQDASNLNARIALHARFSTNPHDWFQWVFDQLDLPPNSHILELGCGPAKLWTSNPDRIPASWDITLSDLSSGMIDEAQRSLAPQHHRFKFRVVDAHAIPFEDARFDAVIANHMLYHVRDRTSAFSEIRRILKPGGRLFAATNGKTHMWELFDLVRRFEPAARFSMDELTFTLENGAEQLGAWFGDVKLLRFQNALAVTDVEAIIAYVLSSPFNARAVLVSKRPAFAQFLERERTAQGGAIHISKDVGLFVAQKV
jgi:SAM-dependent methyltransferase